MGWIQNVCLTAQNITAPSQSGESYHVGFYRHIFE